MSGTIKKREYADRIREVEQVSFTPLVFVTTGGMGREAVVFLLTPGELAFSPQFDCIQPHSGLDEMHTVFSNATVMICCDVHPW